MRIGLILITALIVGCSTKTAFDEDRSGNPTVAENRETPTEPSLEDETTGETIGQTEILESVISSTNNTDLSLSGSDDVLLISLDSPVTKQECEASDLVGVVSVISCNCENLTCQVQVAKNPLYAGESSLTISIPNRPKASVNFTIAADLVDDSEGTYGFIVGTQDVDYENNELIYDGTGPISALDRLPIDLTELIAFWEFNEQSVGTTITNGSFLYDSVHNRRLLIDTPSNLLSYESGIEQQGLHFTADDQRVSSVPDSAFDIFDNTLSLTAWIKLDSEGQSSGSRIVGKFRDSGMVPRLDYQLRLLPNIGERKTVAFIVRVNDGTPQGLAQQVATPLEIVENQWYHVAGTYDGTSLRLYINGYLVDAEPESRVVAGIGTGTLVVGNSLNDTDSDRRFPGTIDQVSVWDRGLSAEEVRELARHSQYSSASYYSRVFPGKNPQTSWNAATITTISPTGIALSSSPESFANNPADSSLLQDLILHAKFDDLSSGSFYDGRSDEVTDSGPFNIHGVAEDDGSQYPASIKGHFDRSVRFDNEDTNVNFSSASQLDNLFTGGGSFAFWVYLEDLDNDDVFLFSKIERKGREVGWSLTIESDDGTIEFDQDYVGVGNQAGWETTDFKLQPFRWYHIGFSYNSDDVLNDPKVYVNGVPVGVTQTSQASMGSTADDDSTWDLRLGSTLNSSAALVDGFEGSVDELIVWNRILDDEEFLKVYRRGLGQMRVQFVTCENSSCDTGAFGGSEASSFTDITSHTEEISIDPPLQGQYFRYHLLLQTLDATLEKPGVSEVTVSNSD